MRFVASLCVPPPVHCCAHPWCQRRTCQEVSVAARRWLRCPSPTITSAPCLQRLPSAQPSRSSLCGTTRSRTWEPVFPAYRCCAFWTSAITSSLHCLLLSATARPCARFRSLATPCAAFPGKSVTVCLPQCNKHATGVLHLPRMHACMHTSINALFNGHLRQTDPLSA